MKLVKLIQLTKLAKLISETNSTSYTSSYCMMNIKKCPELSPHIIAHLSLIINNMFRFVTRSP